MFLKRFKFLGKEFKDKECCDLSCYLLAKVKQTKGNWTKALGEIKEFLKEYQPDQAVFRVNVPMMMPGGFPGGVQNNSSILI